MMFKILIHRTVTSNGESKHTITVGEALPVRVANEDAEQIINANGIPERNRVTTPEGATIHIFSNEG